MILTVDHDELIAAAKEQWFGCNKIDVIGGATTEDGREIVFIYNLTGGRSHRFFINRSEAGMLVLEEYPWA